jgi:hypothetical protein
MSGTYEPVLLEIRDAASTFPGFSEASVELMKRKRVLFVTKSDVSIGGTEKHLTDLILSLDCSKVEPVILCYGRDPYSEALKELRSGVPSLEFVLKSSYLLTGNWESFIGAPTLPPGFPEPAELLPSNT